MDLGVNCFSLSQLCNHWNIVLCILKFYITDVKSGQFHFGNTAGTIGIAMVTTGIEPRSESQHVTHKCTFFSQISRPTFYKVRLTFFSYVRAGALT